MIDLTGINIQDPGFDLGVWTKISLRSITDVLRMFITRNEQMIYNPGPL